MNNVFSEEEQGKITLNNILLFRRTFHLTTVCASHKLLLPQVKHFLEIIQLSKPNEI
jgi:hypothetical protein